MTVDTVNNLFYARVQKPGFVGVCSLVEAMGYTINDLMVFLRDPQLQQMDVSQVMELIAAYTSTEDDPAAPAGERAMSREQAVQAAKERHASPAGTIDYDTL